MERWEHGAIEPPLWSRSPRPASGARGDKQRLLRSFFLPVVPLGGFLDAFSRPFPSSCLAFSQLSLSLSSFCLPFFPPSSLLCPPFQVSRCILPSLRFPPARLSSLQLAPAFSTSILAPSCQLGGFPQQEMKGTSWEMGGMGKVKGAMY